MVNNLSKQHSLISNWVSELRNVEVQNDRMRFRRNLERIAEVIGYEISKQLETEEREIVTPMGIANCKMLKDQPVLATILRAGLAMHNGLLNYFDRADNAFLSAYRKHHADGSFEIRLEYMSCPEIEDRVVIISDPMLATGASLVKSIQYLKGKEKIDNADVYNLFVTTKSGKAINYYIDATTFRISKITSVESVQGTETVVEFSYGDYKQNTDGYWFPYSLTNSRGTIIFDKIETNLPIDEKIYTN